VTPKWERRSAGARAIRPGPPAGAQVPVEFAADRYLDSVIESSWGEAGSDGQLSGEARAASELGIDVARIPDLDELIPQICSASTAPNT
jgi:hypothetical protein